MGMGWSVDDMIYSSQRDKGKIEVPRNVRNSNSGKMTEKSLGETGLNIRQYASSKWDRTICLEE